MTKKKRSKLGPGQISLPVTPAHLDQDLKIGRLRDWLSQRAAEDRANRAVIQAARAWRRESTSANATALRSAVDTLERLQTKKTKRPA